MMVVILQRIAMKKDAECTYLNNKWIKRLPGYVVGMSSTCCYKFKRGIVIASIIFVFVITYALVKHNIPILLANVRYSSDLRQNHTLILDHSNYTTSSKTVGYLCPYFRGGLGNHMFMYSSLYGIAKMKEMKFAINKNDEINKVFSVDADCSVEGTKACKNAPFVYEKRACAFDKETFSFSSSKTVKLKAYLQSWKYFIKSEKSIRQQFKFKSAVQEKAQKLINGYYDYNLKARKNLTIVGVHLRRGDYLNENNIKYGYVVATKSYIDKAMTYMRTKFSNCLFLVFTGNDKEAIKWREENIRGDDVIHVPANDRIVDMCALSKCNHTIITVGSFGWWSAWMANGTTIYFKDVARQNSSLRKDFSSDMSDFFPPKWIGL